MVRRKPAEPTGLPRLPTRIPGLDTVLDGGLVRGATSLVSGPPGSGKTVLAAQIAFGLAREGGRAVYATALTETHGRMLANLRAFRFFDPAAVGEGLYLVSAMSTVARSGLEALLPMLRRVTRARSASLLVLDGLALLQRLAPSDIAFQQFMHELEVLATATDCTVIFVESETAPRPHPEYALVDSVILLDSELAGVRTQRTLQVVKQRGSCHLMGRHSFEIDSTGLVVHPRLEAIARREEPEPGDERARVSSGVARLDEMLHGGFVRASSTLLLGAPGSGKTLLGLSFLAAGAQGGERGVHFGFYEPPAKLVAKAESAGLPLGRLVASGEVSLLWQSPVERLLDALAHRLLSELERTRATRVVIDGLDALRVAEIVHERSEAFLIALMTELRARGVTVLATQEVDLFGEATTVPRTLSTIGDNVLMLRYVEIGARLFRLLSILKIREHDYDSSVRAFEISPKGIQLAASSASAERILAGRVPPALRRRRRSGKGPRS